MTRAGTIQELLLRSTERAPDHPAFVRGERATSYAELERDSNRFADGLRQLGVRRGDRVALVLDGEVEYLVAYYGIAKAGAVVVPLCADTRTGPLMHALGHSQASAVVIAGSNLRYLSGHTERLPELRAIVAHGKGDLASFGSLAGASFEQLIGSGEDRCPDAGGGDELLSITYTSGTTGSPKGVMLAHRNLVANVRSIVEYLSLSERDRVAMVLPFYYVYGNSVLHTHLCAGGTVVQAGSMTFPVQVLKTIERERCTGFSGVPATFARLLDADLGAHELGSLRYLTQAGAAMTPALTERLRAAFPTARIFVMYGQTEAGARLAYVPPEDLARKLGSAGKAIPGVTLQIEDRDGNEMPRGSLGEVVARGENVMLGYWNDSAASSDALRGGALHTGDLAVMDEEGFIFIQGRESEMIKSGAHRIGPSEIESVVGRVPGVRTCAVVGVPDALLGQAIAAFIVPDGSVAIDKQAVLRACLADLPRFKLPEHVFVLPELPQTHNGKVQRKALVEWYLAQQQSAPA